MRARCNSFYVPVLCLIKSLIFGLNFAVVGSILLLATRVCIVVLAAFR